ncbi:MAG: fatty acid desaturase [Rhodovibrionaceae bacterium]
MEWPTVFVAGAIYLLFGLITWFHAALPWWVLLPAGAYVVAWHGSLQHEVVHGHPTPWNGVNRLLIFPSLWLWLPFELYRVSHLTHHIDRNITDPNEDPESYYLTPRQWAEAPAIERGLLWAHNSFLGRMLLGPLRCVYRLFTSETKRLFSGDLVNLHAWLLHGVSVALVFAWVSGVCGLPFWQYILIFAYPGIALTLVRSFLEHRASDQIGERTAVVEAGPVMSLLFLNNNLHALHHADPGCAWFRLPARYRARKQELLEQNGGFFYAQGYLEVFARHLIWPKEHPRHPLAGNAGQAASFVPITPVVTPGAPVQPVPLSGEHRG